MRAHRELGNLDGNRRAAGLRADAPAAGRPCTVAVALARAAPPRVLPCTAACWFWGRALPYSGLILGQTLKGLLDFY